MIIGLLLSLALFWGTTAATASEITLTDTYELTIIDIFAEPSTASASITAELYSLSYVGQALYNPNENASGSGSGFLPPGETVITPGETWLQTTTTSATLLAPGMPSYSNELKGWGPQPQNSGDPLSTGFISQTSLAAYTWKLEAEDDGTFAVLLHFEYSVHLQLEQGAGSSYPISELNAQISFNSTQLPIYSDSNFPNPLPDVNFGGGGSVIDFNLIFAYVLEAGESVTDSIIFETSYNARSIVSQNFAFPEINNKGQVVWEGSDGTNTQIFLERFGQSRNISQNNFDNFQPQINDRGQVVWYGGDNPNTYEIFLYKGYGEPIQITDNNFRDVSPQINNKGWVVWDSFDGTDSEIFLWKGYGEPINISNNPNGSDILPQINNRGWVTWQGGLGSDSEIFLWKGYGEPIQLTDNNFADQFPKINYQGQVVWHGGDLSNPNTFEIFLYKRWGKPIQLTVDNYFDGAPRINDRGQVVWGKGDFFDENTIEIFLYYGWGKPKQLTNNLTPDILPQISNYNQVVWVGGAEGDREIFLYNLSRRTTKQITHNNYDDNLPQINDRGQVTWYADTGTQDQVWLYQKTFFRARSNLLWSFTYELGKGLTNPDKEKSRRVKKAKVKKREPRKETYKRINAYRTVYSSPIKPW